MVMTLSVHLKQEWVTYGPPDVVEFQLPSAQAAWPMVWDDRRSLSTFGRPQVPHFWFKK